MPNARSFSCISSPSDGFLLSHSLLKKGPTSLQNEAAKYFKGCSDSRNAQLWNKCSSTQCWEEKREADMMGRKNVKDKTSKDLGSSLGP